MVRRVSPGWLALVGSLAVAAGLVALAPRPAAGGLVVHAAAALRGVLDDAADRYERQTGTAIERRYGNSQSVLTGLALGGGDLFLPADDSYVADARARGLIDEATPLAAMTAVVVLRPGVTAYSERLTLVQANPDAAAVGRRTRDVLRARCHWAAAEARTKAMVATVTDVATAVRLGAADAGVVWDAVATQFPDLAVARPPEFDGVTASVAVAVVASGRRKGAARAFVRFLVESPELFRAHGFGGAAP